MMFPPTLSRITAPWKNKGTFQKQIRSYEETRSILFKDPWVLQEIEKCVKAKLPKGEKGRLPGVLASQEQRARIEVEAEASKMLTRMFSTFDMSKLDVFLDVLVKFFQSSYQKIIVNETQVLRLKSIFAARKGPVVFVPTHRSYVDFLVVSTILYFHGMEVPMICSGEDFLDLAMVADILRGSGAFFMRRSFRGDELYKAIFYQYVRMMCKDRQIMEFFIEGTRSRSNKTLPPKYGFMNVCTKVFFEKEVEEITFVPVTINYTKTLESESFIGELRGQAKVKESLSRIVRAYEVLSMNLGTMYVDISDPICLSEYTATKMKADPAFDPYTNRKDQLSLNNSLAHDIVFKLQAEIRMMSTTLVASIILLFRQGISKLELQQKVDWLGMILNERGAHFASDGYLPDKQTMQTGLEQLSPYLSENQGIIEPKVVANDHSLFIMLFYFRNPINQVFFNEALVLAAMQSFGIEQEWQTGVDREELYDRVCYLSALLKHEEFLRRRITREDRAFFDEVLAYMQQRRCLIPKKDDPSKVLLRTSGESQIIFIKSLIFPMVDSYYVVLIYILTFVKNKGVSVAHFAKSAQWMSELLHKQGSIQYFESCNQESIKNAMTTYIEQGVLETQGQYVELNEKFAEDEGQILDMLEQINRFRNKTQIGDVLTLNDPKKGLLRKSIMVQFPFMAKL
jgi:glycerol-3-phosphate O-acyltransferase